MPPWKAGQSGNPHGSRNAGATIQDWLNRLATQELTITDLQAIDKPPAKVIAAQRLIAGMEHPETRLGGQAAAAEFICKVTNPKPDDVGKQAFSFVFLVPGQEQPIGRLVVQGTENEPYSQVGANPAALEAGGGAAGDVVDVQPVPNPNLKAMTTGASFAGLMNGTVQDQFVLVESRRGTGKTRAILTIMMRRAIEHPGSRWLVVRSSRTRLTDSAIATFVDQVLPLFGLPIPACSREQISTYTLPAHMGGAQFIFQGLDDPNRQQSVECAGVYVVEGVEIPEIEIITALAASMRQVCNPPVPFFQCIVDCNPGSPSHPLNQIAETVPDTFRVVDTRAEYEAVVAHNCKPCGVIGRWKRIVSHHYDNPAYFDTVRWMWEKIGQQYLNTLEWLTGTTKKRWRYGLWVADEGSVFGDVFDEAIHVVDDFTPAEDWPLYVGWDPGIDHVTGMPWVRVSPMSDIYAWDEVYEGGKSIKEHVHTNVIPRLAGGLTVRRWLGDPHHFFSSTAQSPKSCAVQAKEEGLSTAMPWSDLRGYNKVAAVNTLLQLLQNTVVFHRTGQRVGVCLYVCRRCKNMIMEFQTWSYKRNAKGQQLEGDEKYEDKNNHLVGDPLVGMVATGQLKYVAPGVGAVELPNG